MLVWVLAKVALELRKVHVPSPQELVALRSNVLRSFEDFTRLQGLGRLGSELPEIRDMPGSFTLEDKGAVFLIAMLNEFFTVTPDKAVYETVLRKTNAFVDHEARVGGRAWGIVREDLLAIGWARGWSNADTLWTDWTPRQQEQFMDMIDSETAKPKSGCYVATAVYGSYDCPEVWILRRFRDQTLLQSALGRRFVKAYYTASPSAVRLGGPVLRWIARGPLALLVRVLRTRGVDDREYSDPAVLT